MQFKDLNVGTSFMIGGRRFKKVTPELAMYGDGCNTFDIAKPDHPIKACQQDGESQYQNSFIDNALNSSGWYLNGFEDWEINCLQKTKIKVLSNNFHKKDLGKICEIERILWLPSVSEIMQDAPQEIKDEGAFLNIPVQWFTAYEKIMTRTSHGSSKIYLFSPSGLRSGAARMRRRFVALCRPRQDMELKVREDRYNHYLIAIYNERYDTSLNSDLYEQLLI